jgi:nitrate/nitrite-specific signal transduction histidine kinase
MQERAALLGGSFSITSRPGKGTIVEVSLPDNSNNKEKPKDDPAIVGG